MSLQLAAAGALISARLEQIGIPTITHESGSIQYVGAASFAESPFERRDHRSPLLQLKGETGVVAAAIRYGISGAFNRSHVAGEDMTEVCRLFTSAVAHWHDRLRSTRRHAHRIDALKQRAAAAFEGDLSQWHTGPLVCIPTLHSSEEPWSVCDHGGNGWTMAATGLTTRHMHLLRRDVQDLKFKGLERDNRFNAVGRFHQEMQWAAAILALPVPPTPVIAKRYPGIRKMFNKLQELSK